MNGNGRNRQFAALVLAGDRSSSDPLVAASGRGCKALVDIDGTPMILRVLDALGQSAAVGAITICGPSRESIATEARLERLIAEQRIGWQAPQATPSTSAWQALAATASDTRRMVAGRCGNVNGDDRPTRGGSQPAHGG